MPSPISAFLVPKHPTCTENTGKSIKDKNSTPPTMQGTSKQMGIGTGRPLQGHLVQYKRRTHPSISSPSGPSDDPGFVSHFRPNTVGTELRICPEFASIPVWKWGLQSLPENCQFRFRWKWQTTILPSTGPLAVPDPPFSEQLREIRVPGRPTSWGGGRGLSSHSHFSEAHTEIKVNKGLTMWWVSFNFLVKTKLPR